MANDGSVTRLVQLLRSDDSVERDLAARLIWKRYFRDLLELARNNLNQRIRCREDEEDVLQSIYKSFCLRQQRGEFELGSRDALWKLLVTITLRKARNAANRAVCEKRDTSREQAMADTDDSRRRQVRGFEAVALTQRGRRVELSDGRKHWANVVTLGSRRVDVGLIG